MQAPVEIHRDLVLVGGGHAHALALRMLAMRPIEGLRITLISPASHTPYSGMLPGLVAGHYRFEETHIDLSRLCQWAGVRFVAAEVAGLDPARRSLALAGRPAVEYDLLSLDIGSQPELDSVPGAREHAVPVKPVAGLWHRWQDLETRLAAGGDANPRIAVVGGGGALGVAAADAADKHGFRFPEFQKDTQEAMQPLLPLVGTSVKNPADVGNPMVTTDTLGPLMEHAARDPHVDAVILIQIIHHITYITRLYMGLPDLPLERLSWHEAAAQTCRSVQDATEVPVIQVLPPVSLDRDKMEVEGMLRDARASSNAAGVTNYPSIDRALSALSHVAAYWNWRQARP